MTEFPDRRSVLVGIFLQWIMLSQGQTICNDTKNWTNNYLHCFDYQFENGWCPNGTYTVNAYWTGGSIYNYPEFNCCGCGKGWPVWFVPLAGFTATEAIPELIGTAETNLSSVNLECVDTYGNSSACQMKCKTLTSPVTLITTITDEDFNLFNCTLNLQTTNASLSYVLRIPQDNYLVYFTNWSTSQYNFSCSNNVSLSNESMICRHDFVQCLSTTITDRYVPPDCVDTPGWANNAVGSPSRKGWSCFEYEVVFRWCAQGTFTPGSQWTLGYVFNFPEFNCCACEKGSLPPYQLISTSATNGSIISSDMSIVNFHNCTALWDLIIIYFDLQCLGTYNSTNMSSTILYNCPLNCFFDWNLITIDTTRLVNMSRYQVGTTISYNLTSKLFPNFNFSCEPPIYQTLTNIIDDNMSTISQQASTTTDRLLTSTQKPIHDQNTSAISEITSQMPSVSLANISQQAVWQPPTCINGQIGLNCNITIDPCQMANLCLNNGTCTSSDSSLYTCVCVQGFTGAHCDIDIRPCKPWTCLSHGQCIETSLTTFLCQCQPGYEGLHCESLINYCLDVICQNKGQCRPILLNFTCECTTHDFTGRYCEIKSTSLAVKTAVNRSLGYIAILALVFVFGGVVVLDVLKYVFKIDPVENDRKRVAERRRGQQRLKPKLVQRFVYIDLPPLEPISGE